MTEMLIATLDGQLHPVDRPLLRPDDVGVLRGDGVFETTLCVNGSPRDLVEHTERLAASAAMIDLSLPGADRWSAAVDTLTAEWARLDGDREMVLRMIATRGPVGGRPTCYLTGGDLDPAIRRQRSGVRVRLLPRGFAGADVAGLAWLLPGAKTLSYAVNMAAVRHASTLGDDDVVFTGTDGRLLEGPTATVVLDEGGTLVTPDPAGILPGITVRRLFAAAEAAGWSTKTEPVATERLAAADGAYLTSSARLLAPISAVDGADRPPGPRTAELAALLDMPTG